jgi:hypothetical protein
MKTRLKYPIPIVPFIILLLVGSCSKSTIELADYSAIQVGMTYDEVEKALSSKPAEIKKGASEISYSENTTEYALLESEEDLPHLKACVNFLNQVKSDTAHWMAPSIQTNGQLIYTNWVMPDAPRKLDTVKIAVPLVSPDTTYKSYTLYYISYDYGRNWMPETEGEYLAHKRRLEAEEFAENVKVKTVKEDKVLVNEFANLTIGYIEYQIESQYCIIFDSSSGRVTEHKFIPVSVKRIWNQ